MVSVSVCPERLERNTHKKYFITYYFYLFMYFFIYFFERHIGSGVYILQNTKARGGGMVPGKKMKNGVVSNKMKKKEKGKRQKKKRKRGEHFFLIYGTHLLIIVY